MYGFSFAKTKEPRLETRRRNHAREHHADRPAYARDQARPAHHAEGVRGAQRDARRFRTTRSPGCPDIRVFRRMEGVPLAGTSTCSGLAARWGKRTDHRAMDGHDQKCATFRATLLSAAFRHSANPWPPVGDLFCVCTLIDFIRQGLFAVTVDRNRGRWFELVWDKANGAARTGRT